VPVETTRQISCFIVLAAITASGTPASVAESGALFSVLAILTAGSVLLAISYLIGSGTVLTWGGWDLVVTAVLAWYTATAMLLARPAAAPCCRSSSGRTRRTRPAVGRRCPCSSPAASRA
jgi:succinate-acetate transporter protein